jgi:class 3 adenylate cyclase/tetratricopeptide (TPR) repeat protein
MRCAACGAELAEGARFCGICGAPVSAGCPRCGAPTAPDLRFCTACGHEFSHSAERPDDAALTGEPSAERRRVSVLFVDLEDFTPLAERLDPEEVRAVQSRYFETTRSLVARYGGTVEKFIGDAVVAIWGAPVAYEDDTDRAVRAALAIVTAIGRLGGAAARHRLSGRASVATGEAAVTLGAVGQGIVAGDLVNVAARLQGHAPRGGVLVDETTRRLAAGAATYETLGEVGLKGRAAPVLAHHATAPRAPAAAVAGGAHGGPFIGRDRELRELIELHDGVVRDGRSRLVSITGIAGIGKSRLVFELARELDARAALVAWHAGRAPAYGEGVTFAAVGEMVRHRIRAPIGTAQDLARRHLDTSLAELVRDNDERRWLQPRLWALLAGEGMEAFERDDLFAAWRRYFEQVSKVSPAVLVFEDLQWADPALRDVVEHIATWARQHPIMVLAVARPELLDVRPAFGAVVARFTTMQLERLDDEAMRTLLRLRAPALDPEVIERVLVHAGGVPLYAVEVARSAADSAAPSETAASARRPERRAVARAEPTAASRLAVPDSLHGLIAARIDALPGAERRLLLAAAVLGRRFRVDGLVAIGADRTSIRREVATLIRRELLSEEAQGGGARPTELAFVQDVVRDVAYGILARQARRRLHLAAARWLEAMTDEEVSESLAGHLVAAHDLAPDHPDAHRVARRAVTALRRAAATVLARHVPERALGHLERALRLTDVPEQRAIVLDEVAAAAMSAGRLELAEHHLRELIDLQLATDHHRQAARTRARLAGVLLTAQRNEVAVQELEIAMRAIRRVDRDEAGVELTAQLARARLLIGDDAESARWAERGLAAARRLKLDGVAADLLATLGTARVNRGDAAGLDDLRRAIEEAEAVGAVGTQLRARNNLAWLLVADDPRTTLEIARQAVATAASMGVGELAAQLAEVACAAAIDTGEWGWALETAEDLLHPGTPIANRLNLAAAIALVRALRGEADPTAALREMGPLDDGTDDQVRAGIELAMAWVAFTTGRLDEATSHAEAAAAGLLGIERLHAAAMAARVGLWSGDEARATAWLSRMEALEIRGRAVAAHLATMRAGVAALGDRADGAERFRAASEAWRELGLDGDRAICLTDAAHLLGGGAPDETVELLHRLDADGLRRLVESGAPAHG